MMYNVPEKCDRCGKEAEELNQMCHVPGVLRDGVYWCAWWCNDCAGVGEDETPECPAEFVDADGKCSVCD